MTPDQGARALLRGYALWYARKHGIKTQVVKQFKAHWVTPSK